MTYAAKKQPHDILLGVLCYLSILFFIPLLKPKKSDFIAYHVNQGLLLFLLEFCVGVILAIVALILKFTVPALFVAANIALGVFGLFFLICHIWGIVNVFCHRMNKIPVFGTIKVYHPELQQDEIEKDEK